MYLVIDKGKLYVTSAPASALRKVEYFEPIEYIASAEAAVAQRAEREAALRTFPKVRIKRIEPRASGKVDPRFSDLIELARQLITKQETEA